MVGDCHTTLPDFLPNFGYFSEMDEIFGWRELGREWGKRSQLRGKGNPTVVSTSRTRSAWVWTPSLRWSCLT